MKTDHVTAAAAGASASDDPSAYRVVATCGVFEPGFRGGGPVRSLSHIVDTVPAMIDLVLVTRDRDLGSSFPYPGLSGEWVPRARSLVYYLDTSKPRHWVHLGRRLRARGCDLLYVNSLWSAFSLIPILATAVGALRTKKILIAPRGELSPGALSLKARKKRLFLLLWAPLLKRMGVVWQACSDLEASHIRATFPWARVLVNGWELALPIEPIPPRPRESGPLRLVFISRISPKKNLDLALTALRDVSKPMEFDIFGPVEDPGYWSRCRQLMDQMPGDIKVRYVGELRPEQVLPTFGNYDAFLFPTRGENFGHVIVESLAGSCPVICSTETPWSEVIETGGGVVVHPLTAARLAEQLDRLAMTSPDERWRSRKLAGAAYRAYRQGERGRNVIEEARDFC